MSYFEKEILKSTKPLDIREQSEASVSGFNGIWANKQEVLNWRGPIPITDYRLNEDNNPDFITKTINEPVEYTQDITVKYLKPPTPEKHGDLIIKQEDDIIRPYAPPQIIRQLAARPRTPEPLIIREKPPAAPVAFPQQIIKIPGKVIEPPARRVIIEKMPQLPPKPQPVVIEKWLPYEKQKRKVVYQEASIKAGPVDPVKNIIIQWQAPNTVIKKEIRYTGVDNADPVEYVAKHGNKLKDSVDIPKFALDWEYISKSGSTSDELRNEMETLKLKVVSLNTSNSDLMTKSYLETNNGMRLLYDSDRTSSEHHELEGDLEALKLIDLDKEGLGMYKNLMHGKKGSYSAYGYSSSVHF